MSKKQIEEVFNVILENAEDRDELDTVNKTGSFTTFRLVAEYNEILDWHTKQLAKEKMKLVERIEGMKVISEPGGLSPMDSYRNGVGEGYNQALDDILSALKSEEKEEEDE